MSDPDPAAVAAVPATPDLLALVERLDAANANRTPGEWWWRLDEAPGDPHREIIADDYESRVCVCDFDPDNPDRQLDNAFFIALAANSMPTLIAGIRSLIERCERAEKFRDEIQTAFTPRPGLTYSNPKEKQ